MLLRPFAAMDELKSAHADGRQFVADHLRALRGWIRNLTDSAALVKARKLSAFDGAEEDALRLIRGLTGRFPALARVNEALLRKVHAENARQFGAAALAFEMEFLLAVQEVLEGGTRATALVGIAYQQVLGNAYDPAAALVMVAKSASTENAATTPVFHGLIASLADTLERPGMWREPYAGFREARTTATAEMVLTIRDGLVALEAVQVPGLSMSSLIRDEIKQTERKGQEFSGLVFLLNQRVEALRSGR